MTLDFFDQDFDSSQTPKIARNIFMSCECKICFFFAKNVRKKLVSENSIVYFQVWFMFVPNYWIKHVKKTNYFPFSSVWRVKHAICLTNKMDNIASDCFLRPIVFQKIIVADCFSWNDLNNCTVQLQTFEMPKSNVKHYAFKARIQKLIQN